MPLVASGVEMGRAREMQGCVHFGGELYLPVLPTTTTQQIACLGVAQQSSALFRDLLGRVSLVPLVASGVAQKSMD